MSKGFTSLLLLLFIPLILVLIFFISTRTSLSPLSKQSGLLKTYEKAKGDVAKLNSSVSWEFNNDTKTWSAMGNPPACPDPFVFPSPVDLSLASGILYPGQVRGGDYKPHGGVRFDNRDTNDIKVQAIMDGYILKASKYLEAGEEQISFFYINDCGLMVMHDHFLTLSPRIAEALSKLPLGDEGDSRTTTIEPKVYVKKGEVLATEIGHKDFNGKKNIFVDFGLYDLTKTNGIEYDSDFRTKNPNVDEYGTHALCWFDYLSSEEESLVRSLPAGGHEGKQSDYCK